QYHQLPPALQPQTYQPTSSYTPTKGMSTSSVTQDDELTQGVKLNRAQSVVRTTSPATKIYSQGGMVQSPVNATPPTSLGAAP
ncbi:hypothetical protein BGZ65_009016, partial [Modicella reniformis]